jgi:hypothetical protein
VARWETAGPKSQSVVGGTICGEVGSLREGGAKFDTMWDELGQCEGRCDKVGPKSQNVW